MYRKRELIGITGLAGSGKSTVADLFVTTGFVHVSTSDLVREELVAESLDISRQNQTLIANHRRREYGGGYWIEKALDLTSNNDDKIVLSGLYSPSEGVYLHEIGGFLLHVSRPMDLEQSHKVLSDRSDGSRDIISLKELEASLERETKGVHAYETNLEVLERMADLIIDNSGDLQDLHAAVNTINCKLNGGNND